MRAIGNGLCHLSCSRIARGVARGDFSAREVTLSALDAISRTDACVRAFLEVTPELALRQADRVDQLRAEGVRLGPLAGVPFALKDNMQLVGTHTTCASRMLEGYESVYDATCARRLVEAGAVCVGKTNMDEFAFGSTTESSAFQTTCNPWDLSRVPGGSSGGSAAAVASGMVPLALGTDTGGSIRQPAALCGVVGMKPTYGAVSRYGVVAFGSSLDQVGPIARSVEDVALAMEALLRAGRDPLDSTSQDLRPDFGAELARPVRGARIGVLSGLMSHGRVSEDVRQGLSHAVAALREAGCEMVEVELGHMDLAIAAYYALGPCEAFSNLARFDGVRYGYQAPGATTLAEQTARSRALGFGAEAIRRQVLGAYLLSTGVSDAYYYPALKVRTLITREYAEAFRRADALLLPTTPTCAWPVGAVSDPTEMYVQDLFTVSCNICGNCGISVPVGVGSASGMPVAAQLQGPAMHDGRLLGIARALERGIEEAGLFATNTVAPGFRDAGGGCDEGA